jgi:hypothetical protein
MIIYVAALRCPFDMPAYKNEKQRRQRLLLTEICAYILYKLSTTSEVI